MGGPEETPFEDSILDSRLEDWLVCYLEDRDDEPEAPGNVETWLATGGTKVKVGRVANKKKPPIRSWGRIRVVRHHSVTLVRVLDNHLLKSEVIEELADDLLSLVDGGARRIILDMVAVERMSSQFLAVLLRLQKRCLNIPGGELRVSGLSPSLEEVTRLAGVKTAPRMLPDVRAALEFGWPGGDEPRPLPLSLLEGLRLAAGGDRRGDREMGRSDSRDTGTSTTSWLRLRVTSGRLAAAEVPIGERPIVIGRGSDCSLRCNSSQISRRHAMIEAANGRATLRDLGSTNGTLLNGRPVDIGGRRIVAGDRIEIGPLVLEVESVDPGIVTKDFSASDSVITSWVEPETEHELPVDPNAAETLYNENGEPTGPAAVKLEVIEGVLVLTPKASELGPEAAEALRQILMDTLAPGKPKRIVLNCEYVRQMSSRSIAVLLGQLLRLERVGGGLRLCQVHDRVHAALDRVRLPMLLEVHLTMDDAVLTDWA